MNEIYHIVDNVNINKKYIYFNKKNLNSYNLYLKNQNNKESDLPILKFIGSYSLFPVIYKCKNVKKQNIDCPICLSKVSSHKCFLTSCNHFFCYECIYKLFAQYPANTYGISDKNNINVKKLNWSLSCPLCREEIDYSSLLYTNNVNAKTILSNILNKANLDTKTYYLIKNLLNIKKNKYKIIIYITDNEKYVNNMTNLISKLKFNININKIFFISWKNINNCKQTNRFSEYLNNSVDSNIVNIVSKLLSIKDLNKYKITLKILQNSYLNINDNCINEFVNLLIRIKKLVFELYKNQLYITYTSKLKICFIDSNRNERYMKDINKYIDLIENKKCILDKQYLSNIHVEQIIIKNTLDEKIFNKNVVIIKNTF